MPVVGKNQKLQAYRCDGSENSGGLQAAEILAMATISASRFETDYSGVEPTVMQYINTIAQDWLTPVAPVSADHAMCLLPVTKRETVTTQQTNPDGSTEPPVEHKDTPVCGANNVCIKITPIPAEDRRLQINAKKTTLEQEWRSKPENKDKEPSDETIISFENQADEETPVVSVLWCYSTSEYNPVNKKTLTFKAIENKDLTDASAQGWVKLEDTAYVDKTTWTRSFLDSNGFLSMALNDYWDSM